MMLQQEMKSNEAFLQQSKNVASNGNEIESSIFTAIKKCCFNRKWNLNKHFYSNQKCCHTMKMYEKTTCHNQDKLIHAHHLQIYKNNTFLKAYLQNIPTNVSFLSETAPAIS